MPVNKDKIMIGVVGCAGRMGGTLLHEILKNKNTDISGGTEIKGHAHIGKDLSNILKIDETGKYLTDNPEDLFKISDAIIDFTRPEATIKHAKIAAEFKTVHVIGTTGLSLDDEKIIVKKILVTEYQTSLRPFHSSSVLSFSIFHSALDKHQWNVLHQQSITARTSMQI